MANIRIPIQPEGCYHIYNHAVGDEDLFREENNCIVFVEGVKQRLLPFSELLAYCLMKNHFHLLMRMKTSDEMVVLWENKKKMLVEIHNNNHDVIRKPITTQDILESLILQQFSHCFNSFAQHYNKRYDRTGGLLRQSFKRKLITDDDYFRRVVCYVHNNPVTHGFAEQPGDWKFSSYNAMLTDKPTVVKREEVIETFGGLENFLYLHKLWLGNDLEE
ncbi:MAG: hypothetical protein SH856_14175 [Flavobacteriales bacterium]|nr:hypothetical protein [Flavobacteriales bacterium]